MRRVKGERGGFEKDAMNATYVTYGYTYVNGKWARGFSIGFVLVCFSCFVRFCQVLHCFAFFFLSLFFPISCVLPCK